MISRQFTFTTAAVALSGAFMFATGCSRPDPETLRAEVLGADIAFCARSAKDGAPAAFLAFVSADAILLGQESRGPAAVKALYGGPPPFPRQASLTWKPLVADVAASGELGYTWGRYMLNFPAMNNQPAFTRTGTYVTIWKRQSDGSWKFVVDGGSPDGPPPRARPAS